MSDFRCHFLGSYDPRPEPEGWTDEYLVWFYWTSMYDETLPMFYSDEFIRELRAGRYWQSIEAEMVKREIPMHIARFW